MIAYYDIDKPVELTERYVNSLKELMAAECEMMQKADADWAFCWTWGRCYIGDLAISHLEFEFGGEEDFPDDGLERFAVVLKQPTEPESEGVMAIFTILFVDGHTDSVSAARVYEAIILAQANAIKYGLDYTVVSAHNQETGATFTVKQMELELVKGE